MLLGALAVLVPLTLVVSAHLAPLPGEVAIVEWVNGWPRALGAPLELAMVLGTLTGAFAVLAVVAATTLPHRPRPALALLLTIIPAYVLDDLLKDVIERPRPSVVLTTLTVRDHPGGWSYPSGHMTMAAAVAVAVLPLLAGRGRWIPLGLATAVGVARMYVGVHWPTDLVAGAALGSLIAVAVAVLVAPRPAPGATAGEEYGPDHP